MIDEYQLAYVTGFFDGEGCVSIGNNGNVALRIINTNLPTLQLIQNVLGGSIGNRSQIVNKKQYTWSVYGEEAIKIAGLFLRFSIEKREQLYSLIEYFDKRSQLEIIYRTVNPLRPLLITEYQKILTNQKKDITIE